MDKCASAFYTVHDELFICYAYCKFILLLWKSERKKENMNQNMNSRGYIYLNDLDGVHKNMCHTIHSLQMYLNLDLNMLEFYVLYMTWIVAHKQN